jgi:hypothetical protein
MAGKDIYPWFRMYTEARNDAKLRTLTSDQFRVWFNLLCLAAESSMSRHVTSSHRENERGVVTVVTYEILAIEVSNGDVELLQETIAKLEKLHIVACLQDEENEGAIAFVNFDKRQYDNPSDTPAATRERKAQSRARHEMSRDVTPKIRIDKIREEENTTNNTIDIKPRENAPSSRKTRSSVRSPSAKKEKTTTQKAPKEIPPRPRNEIWDAVAAAIGYEPKTRTECSNWGKVCAELKEAGATPEEVSVRVARYIRRYGRGMLTVNALLTHWGECEIDVPIAQNGRVGGGGLTDAEAQRAATQEREAAQSRKEAEFQRRYEAAMLYAADE